MTFIPDIYEDSEWKEGFDEALKDPGNCANWNQFRMAYNVARNNTITSFTKLEAPDYLPHLTLHEYQYETARKAVHEMNGRAILADEVGLGKTIEAGLILKEYMIRGLVKKVLILAPASLVNQWGYELNSKFFIPAAAQRKKPLWEETDIMISSLDTAKREQHASVINKINYDMVIIDEAHKLKNKKTKNYQFAMSLKKKFCLLLTATPVQNNLSELFHLITLLKPGFLGNEESFAEVFEKQDRNEELRNLIKNVMIRNRRQDTQLTWTERKVKTVPVTFTQEYNEVYRSFSKLKSELRGDPEMAHSGLLMFTLLRELCSSREAVLQTCKNTVEKKAGCNEKLLHSIAETAEKVAALPPHPKALEVLNLIKNWDAGEKVIIFTEYRATQLYLQWFLAKNGIQSVPFRGGFKRSKKDWMKQLFKDRVQVLIATEAGGEGINLQFCSRIINYDLPWNPMRIEQRIGRIHRYGQERDVSIYNFAVNGTIEAHIVELLYKKIGLFEGVIGELDHILEKYEDSDVQKHLTSIFTNSESEGEMKIKINNLTSLLNEEITEDESHATS